jgi:hypothetical protein
MMNRTMSIFEAMNVDPLIYERFIDEMAARGIFIELPEEFPFISTLAAEIYRSREVLESVASTPSLRMKSQIINDILSRIQAAEEQWNHMWLDVDIDYTDEPIGDRTRDCNPRYRALCYLFGKEEGVVWLEASVCQYYGIKPGTFLSAMSAVRDAVRVVLAVQDGVVVSRGTLQVVSAKQAVNDILRSLRMAHKHRVVDTPALRKLVEDILSLLGFMAILRKSQEVSAIVSSPARAIEADRYVFEVRCADEIADTYFECAQEGNILSCMGKYDGVADGLALQYGSLHGVHAAVVIYKDMTDIAGTRKPVARFLVERAVCVKCGALHTVISRRYSNGSLFALSVAEFVAKCIARSQENSVLYGEDLAVCKLCFSPLMTVLDVPIGLDHPVSSDWAPISMLVQVPDTADIMELRFTSAADMEQSVVNYVAWQHVSGNHLDNEVIDPMSNPEVARLYELACKLARIEEPPISQDQLILMIGDALSVAKNRGN